eukprot:TRINITY_DN2623_c0_g1_i1.p1 TRINITY_DN2623_c0_g1~~TRINITY_DN2623_c0_g1_i1.p1  ORF type:complete len:494 (-),score=74.08 TRINITY_DN2623_c0_g1_i1:115-1407(-)
MSQSVSGRERNKRLSHVDLEDIASSFLRGKTTPTKPRTLTSSQSLTPSLSNIDDQPIDIPRQESDETFNADSEKKSNFQLPLTSEYVPPAFKWKLGSFLGQGSFGSAYLALNLENGEQYVVKQISLEEDNIDLPGVRALSHELARLSALSHPNIVRYISCVVEGPTINIFQEYVSGGSVASILTRFGHIPENIIRKYTYQLLTGLSFLHQNRIIHRAIKGANLFLDTNGVIKLADFGAFKHLETIIPLSSNRNSLQDLVSWMAPEVIKSDGYSRPCDIWSVGCTLIEMATALPPWHSVWSDHVSHVFNLALGNTQPPIPRFLSSEAQDFVSRCLQIDPSKRPNPTRLLNHPFLRVRSASTDNIPRASHVSPRGHHHHHRHSHSSESSSSSFGGRRSTRRSEGDSTPLPREIPPNPFTTSVPSSDSDPDGF